jgi:L-Lysine epsilon oxidase N-terminal/L-lysine epsilon oxidase C-terminal domain
MVEEHDMTSNYQVFPAIGVARVGNSETDYYLAPEEAGALPLRADNKPFTMSDFRDGDKKLCRQAARFRVYHVGEPVKPGDKVAEKVVREIKWTVHLANKKAAWYEFRTKSGEHGYPPDHPLRNADVTDDNKRKSLIIDPGPKTVTTSPKGPHQACFTRDGEGIFPPPPGTKTKPIFPPAGTKPSEINSLGEIRIEKTIKINGMEPPVAEVTGALLVLGGYGNSGSKHKTPRIINYANNDGWWDDTSDGPVSAEIVYEGGATEEAGKAWVLVAPPAYAPQIINLVTLYDTMFDVAVRHHNYRPDIYKDPRWCDGYKPDFATEIKPILERASLYPWVVAIPPKVHTFDFERLGNPNPRYNNLRQYFLEALRAPDKQNTFGSPTTGYRVMPYLAGDDALSSSQQSSKYLTLTDTQYFLLQQWAKGKFKNPKKEEETAQPALPEKDPCELTRAALENCVGGGFSPGIEMTWLCRNPDIYSEPFRFKVIPTLPIEPGELRLWSDLTQGLEPGDVTKFMALPWQADFNECAAQPIGDRVVWWWPAQRPIFVYAKHIKKTENNKIKWEWNHTSWVGTIRDQEADDYVVFADDVDMVNHWSELGFVVHKDTPRTPVEGQPAAAYPGPANPDYIEVQRTLPRPGYLLKDDDEKN